MITVRLANETDGMKGGYVRRLNPKRYAERFASSLAWAAARRARGTR